MDADEIEGFLHDHRINAVRDADHPGWLKLVDKSGWVKEDHEGCPVWKSAQFQSGTQAVESDSISFAGSSASACGKEFDGDDASRLPSKCSTGFAGENISPSSVSSESQSSSPVHAHALAGALPIPFTGTSYRIGAKNDSRILITSNVTNMQWFTGQSYKIAPTPSEAASTKETTAAANSAACAARKRWADMEDSDEETPATVHSAACAAKQRWADMEDSDEENDGNRGNIPMLHKADMEDVDKGNEDPLDGKHLETRLANTPLSDQRVVLNPRRQKRNRDLLQRKNKTQICKHLEEKGMCPFGASCWFAHSESELQANDHVNQDIAHDMPHAYHAKFHDEVVPQNESVIRHPHRQARNRELLKRRNKTELCRYLVEQGCCPFGKTCWFAHGIEEMYANVST